MRKPLMILALSAAAVVVGSAVCLPGICGCASWAGIPDTDRFGLPFALLAFAGVLGMVFSLCWLVFAGIRAVVQAGFRRIYARYDK